MDDVTKRRGRPLKFQSVEELQSKIDAFFAECEAKEDPITITGLALALDTTRQTLMDYEYRDEFTDAIKRAKLRVENDYEKSLRRNGKAGDIFGLKNFGWIEAQNVNLGGQEGNQLPGVSDVLAFAKLRAAGIDPSVLKAAFTPDDDAGKS